MKIQRRKKIFFGIAAGLVMAAAILTAVLLAGRKSPKPGPHEPIDKMVKLINAQSTDVFAYLECTNQSADVKWLRSIHKVFQKNKSNQEAFRKNKKQMGEFYAKVGDFKITKVEYGEEKELTGDWQSSWGGIRDMGSDEIREITERIDRMDEKRYQAAAEASGLRVADIKKLAGLTRSHLQTAEKRGRAYQISIWLYGEHNGEAFALPFPYDVVVLEEDGKWYLGNGGSHLFCDSVFRMVDPEHLGFYDELYEYRNFIVMESEHIFELFENAEE